MCQQCGSCPRCLKSFMLTVMSTAGGNHSDLSYLITRHYVHLSAGIYKLWEFDSLQRLRTFPPDRRQRCSLRIDLIEVCVSLFCTVTVTAYCCDSIVQVSFSVSVLFCATVLVVAWYSLLFSWQQMNRFVKLSDPYQSSLCPLALAREAVHQVPQQVAH